MRDLISKLDAIVSETALKDQDDLKAKRQALDDLESNPTASKDPEISAAIDQRRLDLEQEAKAKGFSESFEIGDAFGISFSEDHEIATEIVDILEDGIVIELDDTAIDMLTNEGLIFLEGEVVNEEKKKGTHGKACWKGYRRVGKNDCTKIGERQGDVKHKASQYQEDMDNPAESGSLVFYAKNPDGTKTYALVKNAAHLADLKRRHSESEIKQLDFQRKDVYDWLESRGVNLRRFVPGAETTTTPGNESVEESGLQRYTGIKKYGKDGFEALQKAGREGADEEEKGRIKDRYLKKEDHGPENPSAPVNYGEYDREGDMAKDQLRTIDSAAEELYAILDANENLPEWVQKKITLAVDYIDTARDYMKSNKYAEDIQTDEAKYQGREVPLGKKMAGDVKKSKVYVRKPNGNIVKVNFGDKKMRIKKSNPARRKSFRARHNCKNPGPRWKARYWSCRSW